MCGTGAVGTIAFRDQCAAVFAAHDDVAARVAQRHLEAVELILIVEPNLDIRDGYLYFPTTPGLGTRLRPEILERRDVEVRTSR